MGFPKITVTLFWLDEKQTITADRDKIRDLIVNRVHNLAQRHPRFSKSYHFSKFSKSKQKYVRSELRDFVDGDRVKVEFEDSAGVPKQNTKATISFNRKKLMDKIKDNGHLTDNERLNLYNFLKEHGEFCCMEKKEHLDSSSKKRKIDESSSSTHKNIRNNDVPMKKIEVENKKIQVDNVRPKTDIGIQCDQPILTNIRLCEDILLNLYKIPYNERSTEQKEEFLTAFRLLYPYRRQLIISNDPPTAKAIKDLHPYLFSKDQVMFEFQLITHTDDIFEQFQNNVNIYSKTILEITPNSPIKNKIKNCIKKSEDPHWVEMAGSLLLLPKYMEEERKGIILFDNEPVIPQYSERPYIRLFGDVEKSLKHNAKFKIFVDETEFCSTSNLLESYFCLLAAYYIFNAVYPECSFNTFTCLERLFIEYSDVDENYLLESSAEEKIKYLLKQKKKNMNRQ